MNKTSKIISVVLTVVLLISVFPVMSFAAEKITDATRISSGHTYGINTYKDLETLSILVNEKAYNCSGATFELTSDIEVNTKDGGMNVLFMSFPDFRGTFNGNGHTITGLYIKGAGMFEVLQKATVKGLNLKDAYIDMEDNTSSPVGGIAGTTNNSVINDCTFSGTVINGGDYTGGIVGKATNRSTVSDCKSSGMIFGEDYVGGIAGFADKSSTVKKCLNYGATYATGENHKGVFNAGKETEIYTQGTCGRNTTYKLYEETGLLIISGTGATKNYLPAIRRSPFEENEIIKYVIIEDGVTELGDFLFPGCVNLQYVSLAESITRIGSGTFISCTSLKEIKISGEITSIGEIDPSSLSTLHPVSIDMNVSPFSDCKQMMSYDIEKDNPNYSIGEYGELYNKDKTVLVGYPAGNVSKTFVIPDTVEKIEMFAISCNENLEKLYIPKSVKQINVCGISLCPNITDVYYDSYQTSWEALVHIKNSLLEFNAVELPETAVVHFIDCDHENVVEEYIVKPTCVYSGYTVCHCESCGYKMHRDIVPALGHNYVYDETLTVSTVHNEGDIAERCTICNSTHIVSRKIETACEFGDEYVSGFYAGTTESEICESLTTAGCSSVEIASSDDNYVGTCSNITVGYTDGSVENYEVIIFGDVNGDGWYDGQDAMVVNCIANGMLTREDVGDAAFIAADCNHDGVVDTTDVQLLNEAGILLSGIDQTKDSETLLETSSEYVEYVNLIDQNVVVTEENPTDDNQTPDSPTKDEPADNKPIKELNFFEIVLNYIKAVWRFFVSIFNI